MLNAATSTISVRIRNITLRSTCSALKNVALRCRQSIMKIGRWAASVTSLPELRDLVGIVGVDLDRGDVAVAVEIGLRLGQRHEHEGGVVFRHADLEHRRDLVDLDARRGAHRRHRAAVFEIGMSEYDAAFVFMPLTEAQAYFNRKANVNTAKANGYTGAMKRSCNSARNCPDNCWKMGSSAGGESSSQM